MKSGLYPDDAVVHDRLLQAEKMVMAEIGDYPPSGSGPGPNATDSSRPAPVAADRFVDVRSLGPVVLTILLYGMLLDAAVETAQSGSAVRWLLSATVAAYAAATALSWRRFGWTAKAMASYLVLLVLFLLTAWPGEGLRDGIHLFGQPTAVVLGLASAVAVLLSGAILIRRPTTPWIRAVLGLVGLYGAVAFFHGAVRGIAFPNLFHGESMWVRLPFWLQGTFIGALVLVPAAAVYQIATGLRLRGGGLRLRGLQVAGLSVGVLLAIAALRTPVGLGGPTDTGGRAGPRLSDITFARGESGSQPVGPAKRFQRGIKAVYAFVDFEGLSSEDTVQAEWYKGASQLAEQKFRMAELYGTSVPKRGYLRFILQFEQGAPVGGYALVIRVNGVLAQGGLVAVASR